MIITQCQHVFCNMRHGNFLVVQAPGCMLQYVYVYFEYDYTGILWYLIYNAHCLIQRFSNLASDWLAAQPPANQKPC